METFKIGTVPDHFNVFSKVFKNQFIGIVSNWTYLVTQNNKLVAVVFTVPHNMDILRITATGMVNAEKKGITLKALASFMNYALDEGWQGIYGSILNDNLETIRLALKAGFKVVGTRTDSDNKLFVEVLYVKPILHPTG